MLYAIIGEDVAASLEKRKGARPAHLARLQDLQDVGRLILAGPFPAIDSPEPGPAGFSGSLIVAEFESTEAAQSWADADPYTLAGVYASVKVKPLKKVFPA
ncbi:MAG: YciI family protein [Pseudomonadota bacterium]|nr:YciI family protein [Burkholderiales bacterium]MDQ3197026.1 YciI family protein [Pseudomonadota bacterium]